MNAAIPSSMTIARPPSSTASMSVPGLRLRPNSFPRATGDQPSTAAFARWNASWNRYPLSPYVLSPSALATTLPLQMTSIFGSGP